MHNVVSVLANVWVGFEGWVAGIHPFACDGRWIASIVREDICKETIHRCDSIEGMDYIVNRLFLNLKVSRTTNENLR